MSTNLILGYILFIIPIIIVIILIAVLFHYYNRELPIPTGYQVALYIGVVIAFILLLFSLIFIIKGMTHNSVYEYMCNMKSCNEKQIQECKPKVQEIQEVRCREPEVVKETVISQPQTEIISTGDMDMEPKLVYIMTPKTKVKPCEEKETYSCLLV